MLFSLDYNSIELVYDQGLRTKCRKMVKMKVFRTDWNLNEWKVLVLPISAPQTVWKTVVVWGRYDKTNNLSITLENLNFQKNKKRNIPHNIPWNIPGNIPSTGANHKPPHGRPGGYHVALRWCQQASWVDIIKSWEFRGLNTWPLLQHSHALPLGHGSSSC